jgi:hypothetical protein
MLKKAIVTIATGFCMVTASHAALINTPLPSNTFITMNGLDWAWAYPLPAANGLDLSYQSSFGWRLPTATELNSAPLATDFMFSGANVPLGGVDPVSGATFEAVNAGLISAAACATPYFSNGYRHCDWFNGLGQQGEVWAGMAGAPSYADQLVVRESVSNVPEPTSIALLGLGLMGVTASRRKNKTT